MTKNEILAAKIAKIRNYIAAGPKGIQHYILLRLMEYEQELEEYYIDEIGEYRNYPGDRWQPPEDMLINQEEIKTCCDEDIRSATEGETWEDLDEDDQVEINELLEDYEQVVDEEFERRMFGSCWLPEGVKNNDAV